MENPIKEELNEIICGCCRRNTFRIHHLPEDYDDNKILVKILKKRWVK